MDKIGDIWDSEKKYLKISAYREISKKKQNQP